MILENVWYEFEQIQSERFFKDLPSSKSKERINHFPKMYYYLNDGIIHINVEITMEKYQDQLLQLEKKLETGMYCELIDKELKDSYIEYTILYDTIASRITIYEAVASTEKLKLMESVNWEYDSLRHMLIAGGTGGGKSYFILTIIIALLHTNAKQYILDPKNSDLADLENVMNNVHYRKDDMLQCINQFYEEMITRSEEKFETAFYAMNRDLRDVKPPEEKKDESLDLASLIEQLKQSPELATTLAQLISAQK